jgi:Uma2 family endonuclease
MGAPLYYSARMVHALPADGNRYETVHGELLVTHTPGLWHQAVVGRIYQALGAYLEVEPIGCALYSPADISWGPDTLVQPDVFVADLAEARTMDWARVQTLLLAVEVLSPSTARADRFTKRYLYQSAGVSAYWAVDPDARVIDVWTPTALIPEVVNERLVWEPTGASTPFILTAAELFREI